MVIVEGLHSVHIAGPAHLVENDRELAWAQPHVIKNPLYAWVLGKYVETGRANDNGHIFDLDELRTAKDSVLHAPMNMLHIPHQIMGTFVANEIVYPTGEGAAVGEGEPPYLEALAVFWKYYFPEAFETVRMAHNEGSLAWSMECIPESVTCAGGCDSTFAYAGRQSETYCAHLNMPAARKKLNKPQYSAGALVVPPALPAWKNAKVTELSTILTKELDNMAAIEEQVSKEFPHLSAEKWEGMMLALVEAASPRVATEADLASARDLGRAIAKGNPFAKGNQKGDTKKPDAKPHAYVSVAPGKDFLPCKICKKPKSAHKAVPKAK